MRLRSIGLISGALALALSGCGDRFNSPPAPPVPPLEPKPQPAQQPLTPAVHSASPADWHHGMPPPLAPGVPARAADGSELRAVSSMRLLFL